MPIDPRKDPHARIVVKPLPSQQAKGRDAAAGSGHLRPAASGDPFVRAENEDDDGYDPYSDRASLCSRKTPGISSIPALPEGRADGDQAG